MLLSLLIPFNQLKKEEKRIGFLKIADKVLKDGNLSFVSV